MIQPITIGRATIYHADCLVALAQLPENSIDAYATAMKSGTDVITVTGYASIDGDPTHNAQLARDRAASVKAFLVGKGIDAGRITAEGHGFTGQFGEKDLPANRRVMLAPKPPKAAPPMEVPPNDTPVAGPDEYGGPPPADPPPLIPRLTPRQLEEIIGQDKGEPRANVEKELAKFLEALMNSQGLKTGVRITDRVRLAGNALGKGTEGEMAIDTKLQDNRFNRAPAELAHEIAALLPDFVPRANYNAFVAMKPQDIKAPETFSVAGALAKVVTPAVRKAIGWLPDSVQKKITDSIEDGIVKGITKATEAILNQNNVDGATKEAILKAMEAAIKEKGKGAQ